MKKLHLVLFILLFSIAINILNAKNAISQITSLDSNEAGWIDAGKYKYQNKKIGAILNLKYSQDGKSIFTYSDDKYFRKWDVESGKVLEEKLIDKNNILALNIHDSGDFIIFNDPDTIYKLDLKTDKYYFKVGMDSAYLNGYFTGMEYYSKASSSIIEYLNDSTFVCGANINCTAIQVPSSKSSQSGIVNKYSLITGEKIEYLDNGHYINYIISESKLKTAVSKYNYYSETFKNSSQSSYNFYNLINKKLLNQIGTYGREYFYLSSFSKNDKFICALNSNGIEAPIYIYDILNDTVKHNIYIQKENNYRYAISSIFINDDKFLLVYFSQTDLNKEVTNYLSVVNIATGRVIDKIELNNKNKSLKMYHSPNSKSILIGGDDGQLTLLTEPIYENYLYADFKVNKKITSVDSILEFKSIVDGDVKKFEWDFGDSTYSNEENTKYKYSKNGLFNVKLIISNDFKSDTVFKNDYIHIVNPVKANFTYQKINDYINSSVTFTNTSIGDSLKYIWNFYAELPENQYVYLRSSDKNPKFQYNLFGKHDIKLKVYNEFLSDEVYIKDFINILPKPNVSFTSDKIVGLVPLKVKFNNTSKSKYYSIEWDFGDKIHSYENSPIHIFNKAGKFNVILWISDSLGQEFKSESMEINVLDSFDLNFSANNRDGFPPLNVSFIHNYPKNYKNILWDLGGGAYSTENSPIHTYVTPGKYDVSLTLTDSLEKMTKKVYNYIYIKDPNTFNSNDLTISDFVNPTNDFLNFDIFTKNIENLTFELFNPLGQQIYISNYNESIFN